MKNFLARVTNNRDYPDTLSEFEFRAPDMAAAVKFALHNEGYKRPAKIYETNENFFSALLSNKKFAETFIDIYDMEYDGKTA